MDRDFIFTGERNKDTGDCIIHCLTSVCLGANTMYGWKLLLIALLVLHLLVAPVETQSHTICHVTQCHLATTRAMELISTPCQCVFGQGIASPQSHQNLGCKKSGNKYQLKCVCFSIRTMPPQVVYANENSKQK